MTTHFAAEKQTFWIAHSEEALEQGILEAGEALDTGQPNLETYADPREWNRRLVLLRKDYPRALAEWLEAKRLRDPLAHLADYRWQRETGGLTLTTGPRIQTTRESQAQMTSTLVALAEGMVAEPVQWKAETGWVPMTLAQLKTAATEVANHVAKCFEAEEYVALELADDPTLDVEAAFEAAYGLA